jgi:hypothetical protein
MAKYQRSKCGATTKSGRVQMQIEVPMAELISGVREDIEALCAQVGLEIMKQVMEYEIASNVGRWGKQRAYRHGKQSGYVIYGGRKLAIERPRWRSQDQRELPLESYQRFQRSGRLQAAVARQVIRQCSMRDYEGAIDACLQGYGIKRSSVSRQFKVTTTQELKTLLERPVPKDLLAVLIDAKYFPKQCLIVALGIDKKAVNTCWDCGKGPPRTRRWSKVCWKIWWRAGWIRRTKFSSCSMAAKPCAARFRRALAAVRSCNGAGCIKRAMWRTICPQSIRRRRSGVCARPGPSTRPKPPEKNCSKWYAGCKGLAPARRAVCRKAWRKPLRCSNWESTAAWRTAFRAQT